MSYSCASSRILCPKYHTCDIQCLGAYSCRYANITWPLIQGYGSLTCAGSPAWQSCYGVTFPPPVSTLPLTINCDSPSKCSYSTILCPENATCTIQCLGDGACNGATIVWPLIAGYGTLICDGEVACRNINFPDNPEPTTALTVYCDSRGECDEFTDIYCPESASCSIYCSAESACYTTNIHCAEGQMCNIYCQDVYSCGYMDMYCKSNDLCNIYCSFNSACFETYLHSYSSSSGTITANCSSTESCISIHYLTWSESPTSAPTNTPTSAPTSNPTTDPTANPTIDPTSDPTAIPTFAPTICKDLNGTNTNEGYSIPIDQEVSQLSFSQEITDIDKTIISTQPGQLQDQLIYLIHDGIQQITCSGFGSCVGATITVQNNSVCNIECIGYLSCLDTIINIEQCAETEIICKGPRACDTSQINIHSDNNNDLISIKCGETSSCVDTFINITSDANVNVTCYGFKACDGLTIDGSIAISKNAYSYKHIHLEMMSYSERVTFFNGFGYEEEDGSKQYISCNTQDQYMKYPTDSSLQTSPELMNRAENGYEGQRLPCDNVQIGCFQPNSSDTSTCTMQYSISNTEFDISSSDLSSTCIWIPLIEFIDISCAGQCASSPTNDPTPAPTDAPSAPSQPPTSDPSQDPTSDPTIDPTKQPTTVPTNDPTTDPTIDPTQDPTIEPTDEPTTDPTIDPTTAPSVSPSVAPTTPPTGAPTQPPSAAPSRFPTQDVDEIYERKIKIIYSCDGLTKVNKQFIIRNLTQFVTRFETIIEYWYFDQEKLQYKDFMVQLLYINGKIVNSRQRSRLLLSNSELTLYDLDPEDINKLPVNFTVSIETSAGKEDTITSESKGGEFKNGVQESLRQYFNNSDIAFKVATSEEAIVAEDKFTTPVPEEEEDLTVLYVSIVIVSSGVLASIAAKAYNCQGKVDDSKYLMPTFVALGIYDFMSDINLSVQMWDYEEVKKEDINIYHILAMAGVVFILLPFCVNMYYAITISSRPAINKSPSARSWFAAKGKFFILLCVFCAGTYPVLGLTSSRIYGLDFLHSGLLSSDLEELSEIKIKSTILMENLPQLIIQLIWSYLIKEFSTATVLAFIASLLSIAASVFGWFAQKKNEGFIPCKYHIHLEAKEKISDEDTHKIMENEGYTKKLGSSLCKVYGVDERCIEIGFTTTTNHGCSIHIQHSIFKHDLEEAQKKQNKKMGRGFKYEVTQEMYVEDLFKMKRDGIKQCILNHFGLDDIGYIVRIDDEDNASTMNMDECKDGLELEMVELNLNTNGKDVGIISLINNMETQIKQLRQCVEPKMDTNDNEQEIEDGKFLEEVQLSTPL